MNEIFLGFIFDEEKSKELLKISKTGLQVASNQYQMGFLQGLNRGMDILSVLPVGTYPKSNKKLIFQKDTSTIKEGSIRYLPFVNFYLIKEYTQCREVYKALKKRLKSGEEATVYVYSLYMPFLRAIKRIKSRFCNIKICLIIPDLPGKYGVVRKLLSFGGIRDRTEANKKMKLAEIADSYVFLTEKMKTLFTQRPYTVIEGFLPQQEFEYSNKREPKTILYTGSLNAAFGVDKLLDAFARITDPDYRLWICGAGGIQETVEEYAKRDSRITYFGFLPKEKIAELQTRCDVLINPRSDSGAYTKYSFPSKTMEYLLSGSKVLMYRLPGVPEEYYDYIYTIEGESVEDMAKAMCFTCDDKDFYVSRSEEQINWIRNTKDSETLVKKLLELL